MGIMRMSKPRSEKKKGHKVKNDQPRQRMDTEEILREEEYMDYQLPTWDEYDQSRPSMGMTPNYRNESTSRQDEDEESE
jgi:hypothetical protein